MASRASELLAAVDERFLRRMRSLEALPLPRRHAFQIQNHDISKGPGRRLRKRRVQHRRYKRRRYERESLVSPYLCPADIRLWALAHTFAADVGTQEL